MAIMNENIQKGLLLMIAGLFLFLYLLGYLNAGVTAILIIMSLVMISYGFFLITNPKFVHTFFNKNPRNNQDDTINK